MLFPDTTVGARPAALVFLAGHRVLQAAGDVDRGESAESEQDAADNGNDSGDDAGDGESLRPTFCERKSFGCPALFFCCFLLNACAGDLRRQQLALLAFLRQAAGGNSKNVFVFACARLMQLQSHRCQEWRSACRPMRLLPCFSETGRPAQTTTAAAARGMMTKRDFSCRRLQRPKVVTMMVGSQMKTVTPVTRRRMTVNEVMAQQ